MNSKDKLLHGFTKEQIEMIEASPFAAHHNHIQTTEGEYFLTTSHRVPDLGKPGYRLVTAQHPNGKTEAMWVNPCNGIAYRTLNPIIQ